MTTNNKSKYIAKINKDIVFVLISKTDTTYIFEAQEHQGIKSYKFTIPKNDAEKKGKINPGKVFIWLMKKAKEAICPQCE